MDNGFQRNDSVRIRCDCWHHMCRLFVQQQQQVMMTVRITNKTCTTTLDRMPLTDFWCRGNAIAAWLFSVVTSQVRAAAREQSGFEWIALRTRSQEWRLWHRRGWQRRRFAALRIHAGIRAEARKLSVYTFTLRNKEMTKKDA